MGCLFPDTVSAHSSPLNTPSAVGERASREVVLWWSDTGRNWTDCDHRGALMNSGTVSSQHTPGEILHHHDRLDSPGAWLWNGFFQFSWTDPSCFVVQFGSWVFISGKRIHYVNLGQGWEIHLDWQICVSHKVSIKGMQLQIVSGLPLTRQWMCSLKSSCLESFVWYLPYSQCSWITVTF